MDEGAQELVVDNDIVIKAAAYGLIKEFWAWDGAKVDAGILDTARFVARSRIKSLQLNRPIEVVSADLEALIAATTPMTPTEKESVAAAELEAAAALGGLELDVGESQLAAMLAHRAIGILETGDKRAVVAIEALLTSLPWLVAIQGRIRCLEQVALAAYERSDEVPKRICAEPVVDKALSFAFGCYSEPRPDKQTVEAGLNSYIGAVRKSAPRSLWAQASSEQDGRGLDDASDEANADGSVISHNF